MCVERGCEGGDVGCERVDCWAAGRWCVGGRGAGRRRCAVCAGRTTSTRSAASELDALRGGIRVWAQAAGTRWERGQRHPAETVLHAPARAQPRAAAHCSSRPCARCAVLRRGAESALEGEMTRLGTNFRQHSNTCPSHTALRAAGQTHSGRTCTQHAALSQSATTPGQQNLG